MRAMSQALFLACFDSSHKLPFDIDTASSDDQGSERTVVWNIQESSMRGLQLPNEIDWYDVHNRKIRFSEPIFIEC